MSEEQRAKIKGLPTSLDNALDAFEADHEFLTAGEVFSKEMIQQWVDYKRKHEALEIRNPRIRTK